MANLNSARVDTNGSAPLGMSVGFQKKLATGSNATFIFEYRVMPPEMEMENLSVLPAMKAAAKSQWDTLLGKAYSDIRSIQAPAPPVSGTLIFNGNYEYTVFGEKVRSRITVFLSGRTSFGVQCDAPSAQWVNVLADCDAMLSSLQPGDSPPQAETKSDELAETELAYMLPSLLSSWPSEWNASLHHVKITPGSLQDKRTIEIALSFERPDIGKSYTAAKTVFGMMREGASLNKLPVDTRQRVEEFLQYVGQVLGTAYSLEANSSPAIEQYKLVVLDAEGQQVGAVSISREDLLTIMGSSTPIPDRKLANMFDFE